MAPVTPIEIGLTTAIVAVKNEEPHVLVAGEGEQEGQPGGSALRPVRSARASHLRDRACATGWQAQTALDVGYVEQLYTFGDRGRHARAGDTDPHVVSVGYLALTRMPDNARRLLRAGAGFEPWYRFFPWEDWREGRPGDPRRGDPAAAEEMGARSSATTTRAPKRLRLCFGVDRHRLGRREGAGTLRASLRSRAGRGSLARRPRRRSRAVHRLASPCGSTTAAFSRPRSRGCAPN